MTLRELRHRLLALLDRYILTITVVALVAAFFFLVFMDRIVITIPAGHAGVLWKRFAGGTVTERIYGEGMRLIWPWDGMTLYDMRYQNIEADFDVVDREGLRIVLRISTRLRVTAQYLGHLHKRVGPRYVDIVVMPEVGSHARTVVSSYPAEEVYATKRAAVEAQVLQRVRGDIAVKARQAGALQATFEFIEVEDVLIRSITLPPLVAAAIEQKVQQFHVVKEWEFRLKREELESQRKAIEAEGIRQFQAKVAPGISDQYLRWKGIDATLKLAESPNAKTVIIGSGPQGLPVILGGEAGPAPAPRTGSAPRADAPAELQPSRPATVDATPHLTAPPLPPVPPAPTPAPPVAAAPVAKAVDATPAPPARGGFGALIDRLLGLGK